MTYDKEQAQDFIKLCNAIGELDHIGWTNVEVREHCEQAAEIMIKKTVALAEKMSMTQITFTVGSDGHMDLERAAHLLFTPSGYETAIEISDRFRPFFG